MDNEQLLTWMKENLATKSDLYNSERRLENRINSAETALLTQMANMEQRFTVRFEAIDRRLDLYAGILAHITEWTGKYESELVRMSKELSDVQARLARLENPAA